MPIRSLFFTSQKGSNLTAAPVYPNTQKQAFPIITAFKKTLYKATHWETWHYLAKYIPLFPAWLWYCLKARSLWFFTPSNPTITFGGMEGERKKEMYDQLPPGSYPRSIYISNDLSFEAAAALTARHLFDYPFAVKPDVGMMGFMFRRIGNAEEFKRYHEAMPVGYIVQHLVHYPLEVSVFYYRYPGEQSGVITGFLKKEFLQVIGDGSSTLGELIKSYDRVSFRMAEMIAKHNHRLTDIIPLGEVFCLSPALNLSRGGKLISLASQKDEKLLRIFDDLSHYTKSFYYGRYDIKCSSIEELKQGKNFSILEYNGSGAEPHHVYGDGNTLLKAYNILLQHWKVLYRISKINNRQGIPYWSFSRGLAYSMAAKKHFKLLSRMDTELEL